MSARAKLAAKFQISIPMEVRDQQAWKAGQEFVFIPKEKGVMAMPVPELAEDPGSPFKKLLAPGCDLVGMHVILLGQFGQRLLAPDRCKSHFRFESRARACSRKSGIRFFTKKHATTTR
jgi:hypothetical protein